MSRVPRPALALCALALAAAPPAGAQAPDDAPAETPAPDDAPAEAPAPPAAPPGPRLPAPLDLAPAAYPPAAQAAGIEADVLLELDIDAEGRVLDARVVVGTGPAFNAAALDALRSSRFTPAADAAGRAVPSTIQYKQRFRLEAAPALSVEGAVSQPGTGAPVSGARVTATHADGRARETTADPQGAFRFVGLGPGAWTLTVTHPGFEPARVPVEVADGAVTQAQVPLALTPIAPDRRSDEELVVEGARVNPEVTARALRADEIRMQPGSAGDVVRAIQSLPGMARPPFNAGQLLVRGTGPDESGFYLGGSRLPLVFHFGGLATVVNGDSLSEVVFLPGNYGVRYGRTLGGVIDLRTDPELPEETHGYLAIDLFQSTAFHEQKAGARTAVTVSARRSYIDAVLNPLVNQQDGVDVQLPRYADVQARVLHHTASDHVIDTLLLVSDDRFRVVLSDGEDDEESSIVLAFQKAWLRWAAPMGGGWTSEQTLMAGPQRQALQVLDEEDTFDRALGVGLRSELSRPVLGPGRPGWRIGLETEVELREFQYELESLAGYGRYSDPEDGSAVAVRPAVYVEQTQQVGRLQGTPGVRFDWMQVHDRFENEDITAFSVDPRLALRYTLSPQTELTGTVGRYSQLPRLRELLIDANGNPDLKPEWALATSLGAAHRFSDRWSVEATTYASWLRDVIVGREDRFEFRLGPLSTGPADIGPYANAATGFIGGIEGMVRWEDARTVAWVGATLSRSLRTGRDDDELLAFAYDQPVVATAVLSRALGRTWQVGGRLRFGSGNPYVPVANRIYDLGTRTWIPIFTDETLRMPAYWTVDVRVDKRFDFRRWSLTAYLDLMNATNRRNQELVNWSADYSREVPVYGLPIVPAFGLRGVVVMLPLLGLLTQLGCGVGDSHPSQVTDTQVLAVVTEPAQPAPGEAVAVSVWVADPRDRGIELLVWSCTPYGETDCVERAAGLGQMAAVFTEPSADGRFSFSRFIPPDLEALFAESEEQPAAVVWALACEPGVCDVIDDVREALADPNDLDRADRVIDDLADPVSWLRDLPLEGVNLAGRYVPLARGFEEDRNQNPLVEQRFLTEAEMGQPVAVAAGESRSVRFAVFDPNGTRSDAVAYTTVGRFDAHVVREDSQDDTVLHWLLAPTEPATGTMWVVFDDGDGGRAMWTAEVIVE